MILSFQEEILWETPIRKEGVMDNPMKDEPCGKGNSWKAGKQEVRIT